MDEKRISIAEAAEMMGTSKQYIRIGLQRGQLPFGTAVKLSSIWTYHISPQKFYDYLGMRKEKAPKEVQVPVVQ